ncbi:MAG: helix-turn-helix domain-containing protein [Eubacterium sp.]|nr:helix-turn-helix domain-containing protein [Eubacterium sp.]MCM1342940.1 helix-turn-helix domain-containing protein [Muribaculaceae bacterium]MCM1411386.1 helix-turn-helix domain-containing protein [Lachnospiraceae bacterium]
MKEWKNGSGLERGTLGNAIHRARTEQKLSQETLAEMVGITPTHLKHIESEHRKPSVEVLFRLTQILHLSLDSLFLQPDDGEHKRLLGTADLLLCQCNENQLRIVIALIEALFANRETE